MMNFFAIARESQDWITLDCIFAYRVNRMVTKAFPGAGEILRINLALDYFLR
jgi:hypothetical protein